MTADRDAGAAARARSEEAVVKIVVLGANGRTGRLIVAQALDAGHEVTALVRDPAKAPAPHPRLRVEVGAVTSDQAAVTAAVTGQDAVLTAFGSPTTWNGLVSPTLTVRAAPLITRAMEETGVRRLVLLSAHGVGETLPEVATLLRPVYWTLGPMFADKQAGERIVRDSGLDWTLVYPAMLVGGRRTGRYRVGERVPMKGIARISRADVAEFMLRESAECAYLHKIVELAN